MDSPDLPPTNSQPTFLGSPSRQVRRRQARLAKKVERYQETGFPWHKIKRQQFQPKTRNGSRHNGGYTQSELHTRAMDRLNMAKYSSLSPAARAVFQPVELRIWVK